MLEVAAGSLLSPWQLCWMRTFTDHVMLFTQTKKQAHRMHILLGLMGCRWASPRQPVSDPAAGGPP